MANECYGCGVSLPREGMEAGWLFLFGSDRAFCHGRNFLPKKGCLTKAFHRGVDEWRCPLCGEEGISMRHDLCDQCHRIVHAGRKEKKETSELSHRILANILASFLHFDSWSSGNMAWPFQIIIPDDGKAGPTARKWDLGQGIRLALTRLWGKWGELHEARGLAEGSNLLARLHSGETSLVDYNAEREEATKKIPVTREKLQALCLEVVQKAQEIENVR